MNVCRIRTKSKACRKCDAPKEYYITFRKDNIEKIKKGLKTETRRVIEKVDHYKNIKSGDILLVKYSRFSKEVILKLIVSISWIEQLQDITKMGIENEGYANNYNIIGGPVKNFKYHWDAINAPRGYGWYNNPKVRVIKFIQQFIIKKQGVVRFHNITQCNVSLNSLYYQARAESHFPGEPVHIICFFNTG